MTRYTLSTPTLAHCFIHINYLHIISSWATNKIPITQWDHGTYTVHTIKISSSLQWRHNGRHGVANHQQLDGLFNYLLWSTSKKHRSSGLLALCEGNSPVTGDFPAQKASDAEKGSIWWRHHDYIKCPCNTDQCCWQIEWSCRVWLM